MGENGLDKTMPYEFDGKQYEKASAHQKEWGSKLIEGLQLNGTERVLDLGCGDGALTEQIADLVPGGEVVGIDASVGMIDTARSKECDNLHFLLMDIRDLDFDSDFDLIFSNAALHWVKDHRRLLQSVRRALCDGGKIRFSFAGDGNCSHFFEVIREAMALGAFRKYFEGFKWPWYMPSAEEYSALVESSGLRQARVWSENADRYFSDAETMIKWIDQPSLVPFLAQVADFDRKALRDLVVERMIEKTQQEDGRCFETFRRMNLTASK